MVVVVVVVVMVVKVVVVMLVVVVVVVVVVSDAPAAAAAAAGRAYRPLRQEESERRSTLRLPAPPPSGGDGKAVWRACRARFAALANGVKGRKGRAGRLPPRQVRIKRPRKREGGLPSRQKTRRCGKRGKPRNKQWRPRRARMKRTSPYLPLLRRQEDGKRSVWPPPKLWQVDDGGGMHCALFQAEPATACCC
ncbi:hypothetical protein GWK47_011824 [Chionoecetes opilio]|uniref:Uncharacterized protein n=1 Tax=Chionoecetes opilio TaxID=41210 RepID=A0A8J5CMU7_CHIOP|nr:hypothetical protein GWK47_011824 [Chionoecetes opilio]